jgi:hypothetical protein
MMRTPDGHGRLELSRFLTPPAVADHRNAPVNALGSVGNHDSQGRFVVIQATDGPTSFERCPMGEDGTAVPG